MNVWWNSISHLSTKCTRESKTSQEFTSSRLETRTLRNITQLSGILADHSCYILVKKSNSYLTKRIKKQQRRKHFQRESCCWGRRRRRRGGVGCGTKQADTKKHHNPALNDPEGRMPGQLPVVEAVSKDYTQCKSDAIMLGCEVVIKHKSKAMKGSPCWALWCCRQQHQQQSASSQFETNTSPPTIQKKLRLVSFFFTNELCFAIRT